MIVGDCPLVADGDRWWCPHCDPDKKRLLEIPARRNCPGPVSPPSLTRRVRSLACALWQWACDGFRLVSSPVYRDRRRICRECSGGTWVCPTCGCMKTIKAWARVWECPNGLWPAEAAAKPRNGEDAR